MTLLERFTARYPGVPIQHIEERQTPLADALGARAADVFWLDDEPQGAVVVHNGRGVFVTREGTAHE
jgi:hypothetical protein